MQQRSIQRAASVLALSSKKKNICWCSYFVNDDGVGSASGSDAKLPIGFDARNPDNNADTKSPASGGVASGDKGMNMSTSDTVEAVPGQ